MSTVSSGNTSSHYNPDEPRDWHGRWTSGSSWENTPLRDPSATGRAHTLLGHARAGAWQKGVFRDFILPTQAESARFGRLLAAWKAGAGLDDGDFQDLFTDGVIDDPSTLSRLRQAITGAIQASTIGQMIAASKPLTAVIKHLGPDRWAAVREALEHRADAAMPKTSSAQDTAPASGESGKGQIVLAAFSPGEETSSEPENSSRLQEAQVAPWVSTLGDILGADSTKIVRPGLTPKEGAKSPPSWTYGQKPRIGESGKDFAKRLMDDRYGKDNYNKGPDSEYNKIKKWGDRNFKDPDA